MFPIFASLAFKGLTSVLLNIFQSSNGGISPLFLKPIPFLETLTPLSIGSINLNAASLPPFLMPSAANLDAPGTIVLLYITLGINLLPVRGTCPVANFVKGLTTVAFATLPPKVKVFPVSFKPYFKPNGAALPINPHVAPILVPA